MIDLTAIDQDTIIARGQYATIRAAHEDEKKRLQMLCGQFLSIAPQILRYMQPQEGDTPEIGAVLGLLSLGRETLDKVEACVADIETLDMQRAALKQASWGR